MLSEYAEKDRYYHIALTEHEKDYLEIALGVLLSQAANTSDKEPYEKLLVRLSKLGDTHLK